MHFMDITRSEVIALTVVLILPAGIAFFLGRRCPRTWLGFLIAIFWIPSLLIVCPPGARATIVGAALWSFVPIIIGFFCGVMRRPLKPHDS
jgi:hypothetical protein